MRWIRNQRGVALLTALLMSLVIMAMVTGTLYFVTQSTKMTGAGKRYATAEEAAEGTIDIMKDAINFTIWGGDPADLTALSSTCFANAVLVNTTSPCAVSITLPGEIGDFDADVTLERLFSRALPGGRLEFSRSAGGAPSTAIFYKITTRVEGPGNSTAENSALYRWAG
ncbi:MAG: hypothetical protein RQ754_13960 [Desulfuromonadales bacterium]|nr:hypothetical protein [Desulfuromonadales bacterium]